MSSEQTAHAAETTDEKQAHKGKSATLRLLPNSETLHVVKTIPEEKVDHEAADGEGKKKGSTFHRLPNSETLHVVK